MDTAAIGFAWLTTHSWCRYLWLNLVLRLRYHFSRSGSVTVGLDEAVYRDFVRELLCIHAGRDNWVGYHLLASDAEADAFLRPVLRNALSGFVAGQV